MNSSEPEPFSANTKSECRQIIKDTLVEYSYDNDAQVINLTSEYAQDLLAEALEYRIKQKFNTYKKAK